MIRHLLLALLLLLASTTAASARPPDVYGPPPEWEHYKQLGEAALRAKLPHPDDYAVEWPTGYMRGGWSHKGRFPGYLACGVMRPLRPVEDRYPPTLFVVVIDNDEVKTVDISTRESNSLVNVMCQSLIERGQLPPARLMEKPAEQVLAHLGMTIRAMPEGAYLVGTTQGGLAQHAGLAAGMVITRVNGVALAGMGPAMSKVLEADLPSLNLETASGEHVQLGAGR